MFLAAHSRSLEAPLFLVLILEDSKHPRLLGRALSLLFTLVLLFLILPFFASGKTPATVHEVLQLATAQLGTLHSKNEGDGVHEIGLPCAIWTNHRGEVGERADSLVPPAFQTMSQVSITSRFHAYL